MSMVIPNSPSSTPPPILSSIAATSDGIANPGDTSLESVNAFNKRTNVPVSEQRIIDSETPRPGPPTALPNVTPEDEVLVESGPEGWKSPAYYREEPPLNDRQRSNIVARPVSG